MYRRTLLQLCTLGALAVGAVLPQRADACTIAATCAPPVRLFPGGAPIPGNLIYFKVLVPEPGELTLRAGDGRVIPGSIRSIGSDRVFAPDADVAAGEHLELIYTSVCPAWSSVVKPTREVFPFITAAAAPIELPTPSLTLVDQGRTLDHPWATNMSVGFVVLSYQAACTTCSAAHLTDGQVRVNGSQVLHHGNEIELLTSCDGLQISDSCSGDLLAKPGHYNVEAWSSVVGAAAEPEHVQRELNLNCSLDPYSNGGIDPGAHGKYRSSGGAELDSEEGCSLRRSGSGGGTGLLGMAMIGLVLLRRRRRQ